MIDPVGIAVSAAVLASAGVFGLVRARRDGKLRAARRHDTALRLSAANLGAPLGERATLVQFSTRFCGSCPGVRRLLLEVAADMSGVRHVEIDAEERPDLVRRFDVRRTPTVLILDPDGGVVRRASGPLARAEVREALASIGTAETAA